MSSQKLEILIDTLEKHIAHLNILNPNISKAPVGWHIDHSFKVINGVISTFQSSDPALYKDDFSLLGKVFFTLGFFPRGKAKAPKQVLPPEIITKEEIITQLEQSRMLIKTIPALDANAFFKHPFFGNINKKRIYRFLELHTQHHMKIIHEILKK